MRINYIFYVFIFITTPVFAQTTDKALFCVNYLTQYKRFAEDKNIRETEMILEVGHKRTIFYNRWAKKREQIVDSISKINGSKDDVLLAASRYPNPGLHYAVYNNYPTEGKRIVTDVLIQNFHYEEDVESPLWTLMNRDTLIIDYKCESAQCDFRGRKWTVYYTNELPVSAGPWKLQGLPGVILYAFDETGAFSFKAISIKKGKSALSQPNITTSQKCTRNELNTLYTDLARNPMDFEKRFGLPGKAYTADGKPLSYPERQAMILDE